MPTPITPIFESYAELNAFLTAETPSRIYPLYNAGQGGSDAGIIGHMRYSAGGSRMVGEWDWTKVTDSARATVDGAQAGVNTITVASGHTLSDSDLVCIKRVSDGVYIAMHRTLSSVSDTSVTISGDTVTVADTDEIILEGVPDCLSGMLSVRSGGVVLFDGGVVCALAAVKFGVLANIAATAEISLHLVTNGDLILNGAPSSGATAAAGHVHNTDVSRAGSALWNDTGTWKPAVVFAASSVAASPGLTVATPSHGDECAFTWSMTRAAGSGPSRYAIGIHGDMISGGTAGSNTGADSSVYNTNGLPFMIETQDGGAETIAYRCTTMTTYFRSAI
jgi:hypothetical protein